MTRQFPNRLLLLTLAALASPALAAPPSNDSFASRTVVSGSLPAAISATNVEATKEAGEPDHATYAGGMSVWWTWTAPATGECVIQTSSSTFSTLLGVYTGSTVNGLTQVASSSFSSPASFYCVAGTSYQIAVDGYNPSSGSFILNISSVAPPPANDSFSSGVPMAAGATNIAGTIKGATEESGEPNHAGFTTSHSVWYRVTAPSTGEISVAVDSKTPGYSPVVAIYSGSSIEALTLQAAASFGPAAFNAVAGTTYHIAVDGTSNSGDFLISIGSPVAAAANDNFASRITLSGSSTYAKGFNNGASKEAGEPNHAGNAGGKSVWYTWTAPTTGTYQAHLAGTSPFSNRLLALYTGSSVGALTPVASGSGGFTFPISVSFSATAGTTYQIAVDGSNSGNGAASGQFVVNIAPPTSNDLFANAINLGTAAGGSSTSWIDFTATMQSGEPDAPRFPNPSSPRTIWWKWVAPSSGIFSVSLEASDFDTWLQIYSGTAHNSLTFVAESHDSTLQGRSRTAFNAVSGTTYYFRVRGETPMDVGNVTLDWAPLPASPATADDHVAVGRAYLQIHTDAALASADASFASALALNPNHEVASLLKAITTFAMLEQGAAFQNVLTALGLTNSDVYARAYGIPKDALKNRILPPGTSTSAVGVNYLGNTMLPALTVIRAHLAKVTSPSFSLMLTDAETSHTIVLLDSGDVSLIHACMHGLEAIIRLLQTYNAGVTVADVFTAVNNDTLNVKNVADSFADLLTFTGNDQRAAFKTALQSANTHYQAGSAFVRTTRADKRDARHLFYLDVKGDAIEEEIRNGMQQTSASLDGATTVGGETVNLAQAITSTKSLREQLLALVGNKGIASTAPDPTFDGVLPNATQTKVNRFISRTGFLYEISNFSSWAAAFLSGQSAPNQAKTADPDKDMLSNFAEYAFNLNPGKPSAAQEYAINSLQTNVADGKKYLNLTFVRRIDRATIDYVVAVSDDLTTWDRTGTQLQQVGAPTANADGLTEIVTVRVLADPSVTSRKFVRLEVDELNP